MLSSGLRGGTSRKQGEAEQASGNLNFHDSVCASRFMPTIFIITIFRLWKASTFFDGYKNLSRIGFRRSIVGAGQSLRSVVKAVSRAECSGQFGSIGMRGMRSTRTRLAV